MSKETIKEYLEKHFDEFITLEKQDFLSKYSPWHQEQGGELIRKFIENVQDENSGSFSWLEIIKEREGLEKELADKNKNINMRYQIPEHVHGDIDKALLFHCMENPRGYLGEYKDSIMDDWATKTKCVNVSSYYTESSTKIHKYPSRYSAEEIILYRYKLVPDKKECDVQDEVTITLNEEHIKNIIYNEKSALSREFEHMYNKEGKAGFDFEKDYALKKNSRSKKTELPYYYLRSYYYQLVSQSVLNTEKFDLMKLRQYETEAKAFASQICNIEAYPFSCGDPKLGSKSIGAKIIRSNDDVSLLGARIILRRIYRHLSVKNSKKPIFIFRKYEGAWRDTFKVILNNNEILKVIEENFFYCQLSQQGGGLTSGNISRIKELNEKKPQSKKIFDNIAENLSDLSRNGIEE